MAVLSRLLPVWETPLAPDRGPRPPGHRRQAGVGGQLGSGGGGPAQCLGQEDGGGRDPDPGHGGQDRAREGGPPARAPGPVAVLGPLGVRGDEPGGPGGAGPPRPRRCRPPSRSASSGPRRPAGPRRHGAGLRASSAWHRYVPCRPSSVRWGRRRAAMVSRTASRARRGPRTFSRAGRGLGAHGPRIRLAVWPVLARQVQDRTRPASSGTPPPRRQR